MLRTVLVTVTSQTLDKLCGLYQVSDIDPALSAGEVVDIALESLIDFVGVAILFDNYAFNVFDPEAQTELTDRVATKSVTTRPCTMVGDLMPAWIINLLQAKATEA